jgi:hypothetical protein
VKERVRFPALVEDARRPPRDVAAAGESEQKMMSVALQLTCARLCGNLRDAMGYDGCGALLDRTVAALEANHPSLSVVRQVRDEGVCLDGVAAAIDSHGLEDVNAAVEALVGAIIALLTRLIGEDMALRLVDVAPPQIDGNEETVTS